jgi:hypothetical protein
MIEVTGDLWTYKPELALPGGVFRVITTNGYVSLDGQCVMGRGCAREAKDRYPALPTELGAKIRAGGNNVYPFLDYGIITFPVKHHWKQQASLRLIERSVQQLHELYYEMRWLFVQPPFIVIPRPGCGNGRLEWETVRPMLDEWLDDHFYVITFPEGGE